MSVFDLEIIIFTSLSILLGGIIKGTVGIGMSMFSIPLIALVISPTKAIMLLCFPVLSTNLLQMQIHKGIGSYRFIFLFIFLSIGLILGGKLILKINANTISIIIALTIISASLVNIVGLNIKKTNPKFEKIFNIILGFFSGILGGLSGMYPPLILAYLISINLEKEFFIRTVATMYFVGSITLYPSLIYHNVGSIYDLILSFYLILPAVIGQYFGSKIRNNISNKLFKKIVLTLLLIIGLVLLLNNITFIN